MHRRDVDTGDEPGHQQGAVTQGCDFEASRLELGQRRVRMMRKHWRNYGLLAEAGSMGGGVGAGVLREWSWL